MLTLAVLGTASLSCGPSVRYRKGYAEGRYQGAGVARQLLALVGPRPPRAVEVDLSDPWRSNPDKRTYLLQHPDHGPDYVKGFQEGFRDGYWATIGKPPPSYQR